MKFDFSCEAMKAIGKLDANTCGRIIKGIIGMPGKGDIKPIVGSEGSFRLRIGEYRIWFSQQGLDTVLIEKIKPRGDAYKEV